jgi:hypothetical protein
MDALKYIPDNVNVLRTEKGDARLQKTDIFKKLMWFSYPREDNWIPLELDRVKEIQQQNKDGIIPPDLGETIEIESKPVKVLDYENVVGQDSLTRLDERNRNKKKNKNRNRPQGQGNRPQQGPVTQQATDDKPAEATKPNGPNPNNKNRNNRRFRPNRNNNRNDQNKGNESGS